MMKRLLCFLLVFSVSICSLSVFAASYEIDYSSVIASPDIKKMIAESNEKNDDIFYPQDAHPRVYLNEEFIAHLLENKDSEIYKDNFQYLLGVANKPLPAQPEGGYLSTGISDQLVARALMFALGQVPKANARQTVEYALKYLENPNSTYGNYMNRYKDFGDNAIITGSLIYDWCYPVMTRAQRSQLAGYIRTQLYSSEQKFRPDNVKSWGDIAGSAVSLPLTFNSIAAVAIYDEYPEIYQAVMPRIQGSMADIVRIFGQAGALSDGSIAYSRDAFTYEVALLFERMGHPDFYGDQSKIGYKMLYARLPYGAMVKQGDDFYQTSYKIGTYNNGAQIRDAFGYLSVMEQDPYLRYQYMRENSSETGWKTLLMKSADVETKLPDDLPLAFYVDDPKSEILARTSWQDGLDSPAVSALMNVHNRRTGDHDHGHIGEFQLYYKGPLTMSASAYQGTNGGWGEDHWKEYYSRTISANCVTVYDPNEKIMHTSNDTKANDGGQLMVTPENPNNFVITDFEEQMSEKNRWATTEAHYIGPNEITPAFSYIKGDITNAYSKNKMQNYQRGMVFMDTFNETYPGVLVVFDRVVSTKAEYKKRWLLQSVTKPQVEDNKITIVNTEDGCNGKLVNTTLLPEEPTIETVGDIEKYISGDIEFPATTKASNSYKGGIRLEVSPKEANKEDIFLNAMYVTDADGNAPELSMEKEETDEFVGVTVLDRMVMFSKNGKLVNKPFELTVKANGNKEILCFITDVGEGKWCIEGTDGKKVLRADEDGHSLTFSAKPGTYKVYQVEMDEEDMEEYPQMPKEKIGDFTIKLGNTYTYVKYPNMVVDGVPYFAVADWLERYMDATTKQDGDTLTIITRDDATITLQAGNPQYSFKMSTIRRNGTMDGAPFMKDGVMYANFKGLAGNMGMNIATWMPRAKVLRFVAADTTNATPLEGVDESIVLWPSNIMTSSGEFPGENMIDRDLSTRWSSNTGDGEWACFDLGETMDIGGLLIAWYYGDQRNWKFDIQISDDNLNFTDVLKDKQSCGTTLGVESFKLPEGTKARYVRYVGHGNAQGSLNNSVTEFIITK